jgi:hypothetical protein
MKQSIFKRLGQFVLVAALFTAVVGCSEYNPTGNNTPTMDNMQKSGILNGLSNGTNGDGKSAYSFTFTGEIASFDKDKRVLFFKDQDFMAFVDKDAQMVQMPYGVKGPFDFDKLKTLSKVTIYGSTDKYGTAYIDLLEYLTKSSSTTTSSSS